MKQQSKQGTVEGVSPNTGSSSGPTPQGRKARDSEILGLLLHSCVCVCVLCVCVCVCLEWSK